MYCTNVKAPSLRIMNETHKPKWFNVRISKNSQTILNWNKSYLFHQFMYVFYLYIPLQWLFSQKSRKSKISRK